jgi:hypothetical protein
MRPRRRSGHARLHAKRRGRYLARPIAPSSIRRLPHSDEKRPLLWSTMPLMQVRRRNSCRASAVGTQHHQVSHDALWQKTIIRRQLLQLDLSVSQTRAADATQPLTSSLLVAFWKLGRSILHDSLPRPTKSTIQEVARPEGLRSLPPPTARPRARVLASASPGPRHRGSPRSFHSVHMVMTLLH